MRLKHDKVISNVAPKCNVRPCTTALPLTAGELREFMRSAMLEYNSGGYYGRDLPHVLNTLCSSLSYGAHTYYAPTYRTYSAICLPRQRQRLKSLA